ncbi:MAG TPA: PEP-CTERM sorting domain-containing protein [Roseiarcus sp.]
MAPGANITGSGNAISDVALDNVKIIDPGVAAGTPVFYDINFHIGGSIVVAGFGVGNANANVELTYDTAPMTGVTLGTASASTIPGETGSSGIFSAGVADVKTHTPVEAGAVDQDVYAEFILATHAGVDVGPSPTEQGQATASADFLDPFSFPTNGPVFNFFDANGDPLTGVTADSSDGCIVNNRFLCGASGMSVPEPSTWTMLLLGFVGLGYAGWWRRRTPRKPLVEC